jgi:RNA-directed DNA polymerase
MDHTGNTKGRRTPKGASSRGVWVKPGGPGARADLSVTRHQSERPMFGERLMEEVCERRNLRTALMRVIQNKGSAGADGMTVGELTGYLKGNWPKIKEALLQGVYHPKPVKRFEIPKPGSTEKRKLGIPCVVDRFIQHALLQVLQGKWDETFSEHSYGFRPKRSAHQAIAKAQSYIQEGYSYVVDIDLEKFFDRVGHDRLMSRLAERIQDKRVLKLIRSYLRAGILENGLVHVPTEGTPQGGPLSPFLSNVVLDELDKELEARGHRFVRYADDCNIYVKSQRAGERVMASIRRFITNRLKLMVNAAKSAVDLPQNRSILGYTFTGGIRPNRRKIAEKSLKRFKARVRQITRRNRGISIQDMIQRLDVFLTGWIGYFGFCETPSIFRELDSWIRHRLRCVQWKQWKIYGRRKTELLRLGVREDLAHTTAFSAKGPWGISNTPGVRIALNNDYFVSRGLLCLAAH